MSSNGFWITMVLKVTTSWKESPWEKKTCMHHHEPESKCQSMEWKHPHFPANRKLIMFPTAGKLMLIIFLDSPRLLLEHYQESVQQ
jgi:hypothetical protein